MFSSKNPKDVAKRPPAKQTIDTWIGPDTEVTGTFLIRSGLHIDGRIRGTITADGDLPAAVTISESGSVIGDIHAPHVIVNGYVEGDLHVAGRIEMAEHARIKGDVYYEVLEMAAGAEVNGRLVRESSEQVRHLAAPENKAQAPASDEDAAVETS